jgi:hypothetical protein
MVAATVAGQIGDSTTHDGDLSRGFEGKAGILFESRERPVDRDKTHDSIPSFFACRVFRQVLGGPKLSMSFGNHTIDLDLET